MRTAPHLQERLPEEASPIAASAAKMKILSIVGARPQFIKAAAISRAFARYPAITQLIVHTGQHYDDAMSRIFFDELQIPWPDFNLAVGSGSHGAQTGRMLEKIEDVLEAEQPSWVLVYGDTNSTLAGALAAAKLHIPLAHVEAGLRGFNRSMPEEVNRIVTDHVCDLLFAPTQAARQNLLAEGISPDRIDLVGDVMYDVALFYGARCGRESPMLARLGLCPKTYILATIHRVANADDPLRLKTICEALHEVAREVPVVWPVHPRTAKALALAGQTSTNGVRFAAPVGYLEMLQLERSARVIVTDSGGVQKEAFFHRVPCVTVREETEWSELIDLGWNRLCPPTSAPTIVEAIRAADGSTGAEGEPYGDGAASLSIASAVLSRCFKF